MYSWLAFAAQFTRLMMMELGKTYSISWQATAPDAVCSILVRLRSRRVLRKVRMSFREVKYAPSIIPAPTAIDIRCASRGVCVCVCVCVRERERERCDEHASC